ncbi:RICIN domain-containing protein [Streptomyces sp. NPDC014894]|uniref:RICIN domain-containing protein n=1 Tax=Streptomyces sp. NPDC014894 TaxID=3364931 RepID=UPI0036FF86A8
MSRSAAVRGGLALVALAVLGLGTAPAAGAASASGPASAEASQRSAASQAGGAYNIRAVHSGKCIGPAGSSSGWNVPLVQQPCDGRASQRVTLRFYGNHHGADYFAFVTDSGYCWGDTARFQPGVPGHARGAEIRTRTCDEYGWKHNAFSLRSYHPWGGYQFAEYQSPDEITTNNTLQVWGEGTADNVGVVYWPAQNPGTGARHDTFELLPA